MTARSGLKIVHNGVVFHRYECKHDTTDYFLRCAAKIVTSAGKKFSFIFFPERGFGHMFQK